MNNTCPICPVCYTWKENTKAGLSRGKQRYKCKNCNRHYTTTDKYISSGKGKHQHDFHFKLHACEQYEKMVEEGKSLRQIAHGISKRSLFKDVTHSTILFWMKKYEAYKKEKESTGKGQEF